MERIELAEDASPRLRRRGIFDSRPQAVPANAGELRELAARIVDVLRSDPGRPTMAHVTPARLKEVDALIGVHVMGYERNVSGKPDADGDSWKWRVGVGTYTDDPVRPWTTSFEHARWLMRVACPALRVSIRFGGTDDGAIRKARFSKSHPSLPGVEIPIPDLPPAVRRHPAARLAHLALIAAAMEREAPAS